MKAMANIKFFLLALVIPVLAGFVSSCDNDDDGAPVILQVRTTDPEKADSTFVQGTPGQMIVIEGRNPVVLRTYISMTRKYRSTTIM